METLKITKEHINFCDPPKECFFHYGINWCPGWVVGQIELPIVPCYSRILFLIRDISGEAHWLPANKILLRGQSHLFDSYIGNSFDWTKISSFKPLVD